MLLSNDNRILVKCLKIYHIMFALFILRSNTILNTKNIDLLIFCFYEIHSAEKLFCKFDRNIIKSYENLWDLIITKK